MKRIARRTGIKGKPRSLTQTGLRKIEPGQTTRAIASKTLREIKSAVSNDGHDRQIELAEVHELRNRTHAISSRVLYRVYKSESDHQVHVYYGEAHVGARGDYEPTEIR